MVYNPVKRIVLLQSWKRQRQLVYSIFSPLADCVVLECLVQIYKRIGVFLSTGSIRVKEFVFSLHVKDFIQQISKQPYEQTFKYLPNIYQYS
jgi:hypothetical protein